MKVLHRSFLKTVCTKLYHPWSEGSQTEKERKSLYFPPHFHYAPFLLAMVGGVRQTTASTRIKATSVLRSVLDKNTERLTTHMKLNTTCPAVTNALYLTLEWIYRHYRAKSMWTLEHVLPDDLRLAKSVTPLTSLLKPSVFKNIFYKQH